MKITTLLTSLVVSVSVSAISSAQAETYTDLLDKSATAIIAEKWRTGLVHTRALLDLPGLTPSQRASGLTHLCVQLTQLGRTRDALRACNETIALNPNDWGAYINRGNALSAMGRRIAAKADYRKAAELNPTTEAVDVAESLRPETPYVLGRAPYGTGLQQAQGEQLLAEP
jgi:tetratricopeptide (TPR) repeat protein